jgi:hypothetical protein
VGAIPTLFTILLTLKNKNMCFETKKKSWYKTNCTIDGKEEILFLNEDDLKQIYLSDGDQSGYLLPGNYCEKLTAADLQIERETKELGSCSFCGGTVVADAEKISYKGKVIKNHNPSWGACWDCGAI